jgi:hypothetical protein
MVWAVFEHGTVFFTAPDDGLDVSASLDDVAEAARGALGGLGPVVPGMPTADFTASRLSGWYPDDSVWFIGFDSRTLATIVVEDFDNDVAAGLTRRRRGSGSRPCAMRALTRSAASSFSVTPAPSQRVRYQYTVCHGGRYRHGQPERTM